MTHVSVVIPMYHSEKFARTCLNSVVQQSYDDFDVYTVIDDYTYDRTMDIINEVRNETGKNIYIYGSTSKTNPATARNLGVEFSYGEWVAFLDSDDIWFPNHLEFLVARADEENFKGVLYSKMICADGVVTGRRSNKFIRAYCNPCPWSTVIIHRSVLNNLKKRDYYIFDEMLNAGDDTDIIHRLNGISEFMFVDEITAMQLPNDNRLTHKNIFLQGMKLCAKHKNPLMFAALLVHYAKNIRRLKYT